MSSYALRKLEIRRYRSLIGPVSLDFSDGPVFLLGQNGSGKTTLLELIAACIRLDTHGLIRRGEALDLTWELDLQGPSPRTRLVATLRVDPHAPSGVNAPRRERTADWLCTLELHNESGERLFQYHSASDGEDRTEPKGRADYALPSADNQNGLASELSMYLGYIAEPLPHLRYFLDAADEVGVALESRFDEALQSFELIVGANGATARVFEFERLSENVPATVAGPLLAGSAIPATTAAQAASARDPIPPSAAWLGADGVEVKPRLIRQDQFGMRFWEGFDFYVTWPGGVVHHHSQLSFGQQRLLAFVWHASVCPFAPLLTDELTNGLHASWVREIVDWLGDRQAFHAVQNPLLLDRTGPGERDRLRGRFVLCAVATVSNARRWTWRNPTEEEADRLWASWDAGFQQLSEVLLSEGLW